MNRDVAVDCLALFQPFNGQLVAHCSVFSDHLAGFQAYNLTDPKPGVYTESEEKFVSWAANDLDYVLDILVFQNCCLTGP